MEGVCFQSLMQINLSYITDQNELLSTTYYQLVKLRSQRMSVCLSVCVRVYVCMNPITQKQLHRLLTFVQRLISRP